MNHQYGYAHVAEVVERLVDAHEHHRDGDRKFDDLQDAPDDVGHVVQGRPGFASIGVVKK